MLERNILYRANSMHKGHRFEGAPGHLGPEKSCGWSRGGGTEVENGFEEAKGPDHTRAYRQH